MHIAVNFIRMVFVLHNCAIVSEYISSTLLEKHLGEYSSEISLRDHEIHHEFKTAIVTAFVTARNQFRVSNKL